MASRFTTAGLERLHRLLAAHTDRRDPPGAVALLAAGDDVHVELLGTLALDGAAPMRRDTLFRIASLSKPVTAVAALMLVEDGALRLDDAIEPWLPELANRRVLRDLSSALNDTVPAERAITLRDVLTYRMGFGSVTAPPGTYPIQRLIREYRLGGDGPMVPTDSPGQDEWLRRLSSLPWLAQPGERWLYHTSGDVLGVLVARVAGASLGAFMQERIFAPLGMRDTGFSIAEQNLARLPVQYVSDRANGGLRVFDGAPDTAWRDEPAFQAGGGGLVATLDDLTAFCRMLLRGGRHGGRHLLSRATVELMTADHVTPQQRVGSEIFFGEHASWGLGIAVDIRRREIYHSPGRFGWTGGFGTTAYVDPANDLIGVLLTQRMMDSPEPPRIFTDFWTAAYAALA